MQIIQVAEKHLTLDDNDRFGVNAHGLFTDVLFC